MANYPNAVEMIFGRIDRNNDTGFRDRSLQQNQNQFNTQIDLDKNKLEIARKQFLDSLALQRDQFNSGEQQRQFAQSATMAEAMGKGLIKPADTVSGVKPDNMFMQNPAVGPVSVSNNNMPTLNMGGLSIQPVDQFAKSLQENAASYKQKLNFENQAKADRINTLTQLGVPPAMAFIQAEDPALAAHIMSSPQNLMSYLTMVGKGEPGAMNVAKHVMEYMSGYQGAVAQASETDSMRAMHMANAGESGARSNLLNTQASTLVNTNKGEALYNEASAAVARQGINSSDPRYIGAVRSYIDSQPVDPMVKSAASSVATRDLQPRTLGSNPLMEMLQRNSTSPANAPRGTQQLTPTQQITPNDLTRNDNWKNRAVVPGAPPASTNNGTSRESGTGPTVVNTEPATTTGPVGANASGALQYTQPAMPQPNAQGLIPITRNDGSVDGYVSPEQWQAMNQPATGVGGMGISNPFSAFSRMMLEYQQRNAQQRQQQYNPNNQGFGFRPPNY